MVEFAREMMDNGEKLSIMTNKTTSRYDMDDDMSEMELDEEMSDEDDL